MESLRLAATEAVPVRVPCCRCGRDERAWDRIVGKAYCPNCQEMLAIGEGEPLIEKTHDNRCAICARLGTVCFHSFPLQKTVPIAIELCPEHLRALLGRRLGPYGYHQLRRLLEGQGIDAHQVFLLHGAFYDVRGRALQPAIPLP
jgi:hypothetical protein